MFKVIALHDYFSGVSGESLQSLIRFMYAGNLYLNSENVQFMLQTATQLMVKPAINLCQRFLSENEDLCGVDRISSLATEKLENNLDQVISCFIFCVYWLAKVMPISHISAQYTVMVSI